MAPIVAAPRDGMVGMPVAGRVLVPVGGRVGAERGHHGHRRGEEEEPPVRVDKREEVARVGGGCAITERVAWWGKSGRLGSNWLIPCRETER
jgi:hypothetical protein